MMLANRRAIVNHVYTYFNGFLPRDIPLSCFDVFSAMLVRLAATITSNPLAIETALALCYVSEDRVAATVAFVNVSRNFLECNPAFARHLASVGQLDTLGLSFERRGKALYPHLFQTTPVELVKSLVRRLEAAPALIMSTADASSSTAGVVMATASALPNDSPSQEIVAHKEKSKATEFFSYFSGFLPRDIPLSCFDVFSAVLVRMAAVMTSQPEAIEAVLALCYVSEDRFSSIVAFVKVSRDFLENYQTLASFISNIGQLDTLGLSFERRGKALYPHLFQSAPIELVKSYVRRLEAAPALTFSTTDVPAPIVVAVAATAAAAPAAAPPSPTISAVVTSPKKTVISCPPGLNVKYSPSEFLAAQPLYEEAFQPVYAASFEAEPALAFTELIEEVVEHVEKEEVEAPEVTECNVANAIVVAASPPVSPRSPVRRSVFERLGPVPANDVDNGSSAARVSAFKRLGPISSPSPKKVASPTSPRKSVLERLGRPVPSAAGNDAITLPRISVLKRLGSNEVSSGPSSGRATPLSEAGAVVSLNEAATEVAVAGEKPKKKTRRAGRKITAKRNEARELRYGQAQAHYNNGNFDNTGREDEEHTRQQKVFQKPQ
jgi:hypothetical protein